MDRPIVFYSWQSDLPPDSTRSVVKEAAIQAITGLSKDLSLEDSPRLDQDTHGRSGTPAVGETIFRKIEHSAVFLADVSIVGKSIPRGGQKEKCISNPNVLIEQGYAAARIGWDRIILVMNKHYGSPERLPFDLKFRRFPATFNLGPQSEKRPAAVDALGATLKSAIGTCLAAEYVRVDAIMAQLASYARNFIRDHHGASVIYETSRDNNIVSRDDLAILQLLELNVIQCIQYTREIPYAYTWSYLGRQCIARLGLPTSSLVPDASIAEPQSIKFDFASYEALSGDTPCNIEMPVRYVGDQLEEGPSPTSSSPVEDQPREPETSS